MVEEIRGYGSFDLHYLEEPVGGPAQHVVEIVIPRPRAAI